MKRRISTCLFALSTAVLACSSVDPDKPSPKDPPVQKPHDPAPGLQSACAATQADAFGPISGSDVVATATGVFLAKQRALFRATSTSTSSLPALVPVAGFPEAKGPDSLAVQGDTLFASISTECENTNCTKNRIVKSDDQGATWTDLAGFPSELQVGVQLHANDEYLLAIGWGGDMAVYDYATESWTYLHPEPTDDAVGGHMVTSFVGFDGAYIIANDVYGTGLVQVPPYGTQWERVQGLTEWGYAGFVTRDTVKVTSNGGGFFATIDGVWTKTFEYENGGMSIVDVGDGFLASDEKGNLLRSTDGVAWKVVESSGTTTFQPGTISRNGDTLVWLGPGLQLSTDNGTTWQELTTVTEDVPQVRVLGDSLYAKHQYYWQAWHDDSWSKAAFDDSGLVAFGAGGVYTCDQYDLLCSFHPNGQPTATQSAKLNAPEKIMRGIFATSHGLLMTTMEEWNWDCDWAERSGLARFDPADGTLHDMANGLPYDDTGTCRLYWLVRNVVEVDGTLFASIEDDFDTLAKRTYRSDDGAKSWSQINDDAIVTAVDDGHGIVAWFTEGGLQRSTDGGVTFTPLQAPPGEGAITDLVTLGGRVVVSRSSSHEASVWSATGTGTWAQLKLPSGKNIGPVQDLDVQDGQLWLATSTSGAWQLTSGCLR